jgi:HK97 family phage major capsid protein/HK97 family phage prohead protease
MTVIRKTHASTETNGMQFVLSDATPDRYGDVIEAAGWELKEFKTNPIALFNHNPDFPIGRWANVKVEKDKLVGELKMAPRGTSARIDELLNLIDAGILRAVSVGFLPDEYEQMGRGHGSRYTKQRLIETSLVSIPANPNALAIAKSLGVSPETLDVAFGKNADKGPIVVKKDVSPASTPKTIAPSSKDKTTMSYAKKIQELQAKQVELQDHIKTLVEQDSDSDTIDPITEELEKVNKSLASFERLEAATAPKGTTPAKKSNLPAVIAPVEVEVIEKKTDIILPVRRQFAQAVKKEANAVDLLVKAIAMDIKHFGEDRKRSIDSILKMEYGDGEMFQKVGTIMSRFGINKAAAIPADTTTSGWADSLAQTVIGDFIESLLPYSIYPQLRQRGGSFTFGRNGTISLPARNTATTVAGAFVAQGAAIPVRQGAFTAITLTPKKMGVITTMTREITEHSTPQIEAILKQAMLEDTGVAIDTVLLDATAASTTRPAGLKNGIAKVTVSGTASIVGFIADLKTLYQALITATNGNVRSPVWIMNPGDVLTASLIQTTTGDTPFRDEISRGTLLGIPIVQSTTGLNDTMAIMDAADFLTATGDTPQFSVSDQAVLHMEDTTPTALSTVATPNTVAAPIRSLWQTDTMAIRMLLDINWAKRRAGIFQWADTMVWN